KMVVLFFNLLLIACTNQNSDNKESEQQWLPLLNGNDLSDWTIKMGGQGLNQDVDHVFQLENGVLKVYDGKRENSVKVGHIFYHKKTYSNFRLRFEYRFTGRQYKPEEDWPVQYGGVVFHAQSPETMGHLQEYPICLEFQLLGGKNTGERPTGNVCTIGTQVYIADTLNPHHCINSSSPTYEGDQWVKAEIEVWSDSLVRHYING